MKTFIEKYSPYAFSLIVAGGILLLKQYLNNYNQIFDQIVANSLSISGTLIGFFLTILTIISTITTRRMRFLKEAGLFPRLLSYLNSTIIWHLAVISIGLFLPMIRQFMVFKPYSFNGKTFILWIIVLSWSLSVRFTHIFLRLLHDPQPVRSRDDFISID